MKIDLKIGLYIVTALFLCSCIPNKKVIYFPDPAFNYNRPTAIPNGNSTYFLQPGDVVNIRIKTLDKETADYFNIMPENGLLNFTNPGFYINSYSIDLDGTIDLPEAGKIEVAGLSVNQAQELVKNTLQPYLSNASILLKLVSFKITVLGEVNNPGYYFIYNDQATLLEGLGLAGDLTDFGNRENITIIRQVDEGSEAILVNLKDPKVLASEYYYLKPNDVVYVQPLKAKNTRNNLNTFTLSSIVFGAVSSTLLILSYLDDN